MTEPPGPNRWFFDLWSRFYDAELVQRLTYWPIHDGVVRELRQARPRRILDVGCGTGQLEQRARVALPGVEIVGCDFSAGMLAQARRRLHEGAWVRGDACRLPFRADAFDAVVSTEAFHWFPDQDAALREFRRVLRVHGRLLLALVNPRFPLLSAVTHVGSRFLGEPFYWPTSAAMREKVQDAGFKVRRQRELTRLPGIVLFPPVLTVAERV